MFLDNIKQLIELYSVVIDSKYNLNIKNTNFNHVLLYSYFSLVILSNFIVLTYFLYVKLQDNKLHCIL